MKKIFSILILGIIAYFLLIILSGCIEGKNEVSDTVVVKSDFSSKEYLNLNEKEIFGYKNSDLKVQLCKIKPKRQVLEKYAERNSAWWVSLNSENCPRFVYVSPENLVLKSKAPKLIDKGWKSAYENSVHQNMTVRMLKYKNPWKWAKFIKAMAKAESNWNPNTFYVEKTIFDRHGKNVVSRGMLQISIESAGLYGCVLEDKELHIPEKNIECGMKIINRLLKRDGQVMGKKNGKWVGLSRYWSVLREGGSGYKRFMKEYKK